VISGFQCATPGHKPDFQKTRLDGTEKEDVSAKPGRMVTL